VYGAIAKFDSRHNLRSEDGRRSAWTEAYRIELLLLLAEPAARLTHELEYRLAMADSIGVTYVANLRIAYEQAINRRPSDEGKKACYDSELEANCRSILIETVEQIQWQQIKERLARCFLRHITVRIVGVTMVAFFCCVFLYMLSVKDYVPVSTDVNAMYAPYTDVRLWGVIPVPTLVCLSAGLFGSYFSRMLYIKNHYADFSYDELLSARDASSIILRGAVGVCGAAVVYFLLRSGIVSSVFAGTLVPDLDSLPKNHESPNELVIANKDLALLIIWGFFAGFSERLIPNILSSTETKLVTTEEKGGHTGKRSTRHHAARE
jgi:hypothetical protein